MKLEIPKLNIEKHDSIVVLRILKDALILIKHTTNYEGIIYEDDNTFVCDTNDVIRTDMDRLK